MGRASQKFDRQLFTLKLAELSRQMQIKSVASNSKARVASREQGNSLLMHMVGGQLALLRDEWLTGIDRIAREVWQTQGEVVTPDFVREILVPEAMTIIGAKESQIKRGVTPPAPLTYIEDPHPTQRRLTIEIRKLKGEVANRYEIEARELEYQKAPAAHAGPQSQFEELGGIRGLIEDALRDTVLWLQMNSSAEERAHVLGMQYRLADLDRIIARRVERRSSRKDGWQWSETAREVLSLLKKAEQVRGNIVGKGLARLPDHLPTKLPGMKLPEPMEPVNTSLRSLTAVTGKASEKNQEEKQSTQLPANLQHAGDPVDGNPFPADDLRHKVWKDATLKAEEEACRVNSEFLKQSPTGQQGFVEWVQQGKMASAAQYFATWTLALCVAKFDIWAKRGIHVVWSEAAVKAYDQWLCNYAQSWLNAQEKLDNLSHSALLDLRSRLVERVEYWKAEARRYLSEQRKALDQSEPRNSTGVDRLRTNANQTEPSSAQNSTNSAPNVQSKSADAAADPPPNDEKVKQGNAVVEFGDVLTAVGGGHGTWVSVARGNGVKDKNVARMTKASLKALLKQKGLSPHGWATQAGVDFHTADDYLKSETKPYPDTLKKLADALGVKVELLPE